MIDDLTSLDVLSISPSVRALLEDEMNKQRKNRILEKHKYVINQCADGRWCTTFYENGKRKKLSSTTETGLYSKLDEIYFGKPKVLSFGEIFEAMCDYQEHEPSHKRTKNTKKHEGDFPMQELKDRIVKEDDQIRFSKTCHHPNLRRPRYGNCPKAQEATLSM